MALKGEARQEKLNEVLDDLLRQSRLAMMALKAVKWELESRR